MGSSASVAWSTEECPEDQATSNSTLDEALAPAEKSAACADEMEAAAERDSESLLARTPDGRQYHLDVWRFIAISIVVLDHGNGNYSYWNALFGQNWCLQFIFVICGLNFFQTRKTFAGYALRLGEYFTVGVLFNLFAFVTTGRDVAHDWWNMVFQFWFVAGLLLYSVMLVPLRAYLRWIVQERERLEAAARHQKDQRAAVLSRAAAKDLEVCTFLKGVATIIAGLLFLYATISIELGRLSTHVNKEWLEKTLGFAGTGLLYWAGKDAEAGIIIQTVCAAAELTLSNIWLAVAVPYVFPHHQSVTGWLVLTNMTLRRLCDWYSGAGEKVFNGLDIMLLGLTCMALGMKWRRPVGIFLTRYWFVWMGICALVWKPGTSGRLDLLEEVPWNLTWRMRIIDFIYMAVFLTAGERFVDPKIFTEDRCDFLTWLGFCLFLDHRAIHLIFPWPWNWFVLILHGPAFWYVWKKRRGGFDRDPAPQV